MFKVGQIVSAEGHGTTVFKILELQDRGQFAVLQAFSVSHQKMLGKPLENVPTSTLIPFKEDSSQAALRIVRDATKDK